MASLTKRLEMLEAALAARRPEQVVRAVKGPQDRNTVLDQMVSSGEINPDQRDDVLVIRHIIVPWKYQDTAPDREQAAFALLAKRENKSPSVSNGGKPNGVLR